LKKIVGTLAATGLTQTFSNLLRNFVLTISGLTLFISGKG